MILASAFLQQSSVFIHNSSLLQIMSLLPFFRARDSSTNFVFVNHGNFLKISLRICLVCWWEKFSLSPHKFFPTPIKQKKSSAKYQNMILNFTAKKFISENNNKLMPFSFFPSSFFLFFSFCYRHFHSNSSSKANEKREKGEQTMYQRLQQLPWSFMYLSSFDSRSLPPLIHFVSVS